MMLERIVGRILMRFYYARRKMGDFIWRKVESRNSVWAENPSIYLFISIVGTGSIFHTRAPLTTRGTRLLLIFLFYQNEEGRLPRYKMKRADDLEVNPGLFYKIIIRYK